MALIEFNPNLLYIALIIITYFETGVHLIERSDRVIITGLREKNKKKWNNRVNNAE